MPLPDRDDPTCGRADGHARRGPRPTPPTDSTHGARMKTAWTGRVAEHRASSRSASKESTWRPNALRRTVTSRPPMVSWSGRPPSIRSASMIMPGAGAVRRQPAARRARAAAPCSPQRSARLLIVVDSPPGTTRASIPSRSSTVRTRRVADAERRAARSRARGRRPAGRGPRRGRQPRSRTEVTSHGPRGGGGPGRSATLMPTMASPRPRLTLATIDGSS